MPFCCQEKNNLFVLFAGELLDPHMLGVQSTIARKGNRSPRMDSLSNVGVPDGI